MPDLGLYIAETQLQGVLEKYRSSGKTRKQHPTHDTPPTNTDCSSHHNNNHPGTHNSIR